MESRLPMLQYGPEPGSVTSDDSNATRHAGSNAGRQLNSSEQAGKRPTVQRNYQTRGDNSRACKSEQPDHDVMQALSLERRRRAFIGMLRLLEHGAQNPQQLNRLIAPMSDEELLQVAEERSLAGKCGNPLCAKPFDWNEPRQKYRATAENVHKLEGDCYCSKSCGSLIRQLAAQLVNPMERIQPAALQQQLAQPSHRPKQGVAAQGGGVTTMRSHIQERDPFQLIHEAEEAGKQLEQAAAQRQSCTDAAAATTVEGFIPRAQPSRHQQQQQQAVAASDGANEIVSEPLEVLQLNPVMRKHKALATCKQAAATCGTSNGHSREHDDVYLQLHKAHQDQQLRQQHNNNVGSLAMQEAVPVQQAAAAVEGSNGSGGLHPLADPQHVAARQPSPQQPSRRRRIVTFAPTVDPSCSMTPQQPPDQPVLTFSVHAPTSTQPPRSSSSAELLGQLTLSSIDDTEDHHMPAEGGEVRQIIDADSNGIVDAAPELPEAWRLFFPPALGGVGVPVKQVVQARPVSTAGGQKQQRSGRLPQQPGQLTSQQQATQAKEAVDLTKPHRVAASAVPAAAVVAAGTPGHCSVPAALQHKQAAADSSLAGEQTQKEVPDSMKGGQSFVAGQQQPETCTPQSDRSTTGAAAAPRKFTPTACPRRSVVLLDSVPGVTIKKRGMPYRCNQGATNAPSGRQQQHQDRFEPAGPVSSAAAGQSQPLGAGQSPQEPQQQQQQQHLPEAVMSVSTRKGSAGSMIQSSSTVNKFSINCLSGVACDSVVCERRQVSSAADGAGRVSDAIKPAPGRQHRHSAQGPQHCVSSCSSPNLDDVSGSADEDSNSSDCAADVGDVAVNDGSSDSGHDEPSSDSSEDEGGGRGLSRQLKGALQSLLPFMDTHGVTVHLSEFGMLWNAMHAWISPATIAYVNNKQAAAAVAAAIDAAGSISGGKPAATAAAGGRACGGDEIEQRVVPSRLVLQQRTALANMLASALPAVLEQLAITVPQAQLTRHLHALIRSFYMPGPLPALQMHHWQVVVALMLAALSAWHVPSMRHCFSRQQPANNKLGRMLNQLGTDIDRFMALLDLFELNI